MPPLTPPESTGDFTGLVEAAPDAVVVVDHRGLIVLVNRQTEVLFGYAREELHGQPVEILVPDGVRTYHQQHRERYASEPRVRAMGPGLDLRARRKDGTEFAVEISLGPLRTADDILTSAVIRDVSRKRRDERLFRGLLESAPDAVVIVDETGHIVLVNQHVEELFGYARADLIGRSIEVLIPDRFVGMHVGYRAGYFSHPVRRPMGPNRQLVARRKDATEFPVEISLAPLDSDEGLLVSAAVRDVTERRQLEANAELYRVKDEFFATVSHELRTPLTSIIGFGELLSDSDEISDQGREFLAFIMRGAWRELRLVDDLLTLVHIEDVGLTIHRARIDLCRVVLDCVEGMRQRAEKLDIALTAELPFGELVVEADNQRLSQAIDNVLSNAIKFTPPGGAVAVHVHLGGDTALVDVRDTGPGVANVDRDRIFERLYRSSSAIEQQIPGAGLGLTITLAIIEAHEGSVRISDTSPLGTTMTITVPLQAPEPAATGVPWST